MELGQGNLVSFSSSPSVSLQPKLPDPPTLMPHHDFPSRTRYLGNKQNQKMFRNLLMERVMKGERVMERECISMAAPLTLLPKSK